MTRLGTFVAAVMGLSALAVGVDALMSMRDYELSDQDWVAVAVGATATLALGVGLVALLYYSRRSGFDARAAAPPERDESKSR